MSQIAAHLIANLVSDLEGPYASKVLAACFSEGEEMEHQNSFFRLWGRVVRIYYNARTTVTSYFFVEGEDLDLFNIFYPEA